MTQNWTKFITTWNKDDKKYTKDIINDYVYQEKYHSF